MTDHTVESELTQRKGKETAAEEVESDKADKEPSETVNETIEVRTTWQTIKYYFNRFRYYHFLVADTVDKYLSAACLWLINLYFRFFMGVGQQAPSVLDDEPMD